MMAEDAVSATRSAPAPSAGLVRDLHRFRQFLSAIACFDERYSVGLALTTPSLCATDYAQANLQRAEEIAGRVGLRHVSVWIGLHLTPGQSAFDR